MCLDTDNDKIIMLVKQDRRTLSTYSTSSDLKCLGYSTATISGKFLESLLEELKDVKNIPQGLIEGDAFHQIHYVVTI